MGINEELYPGHGPSINNTIYWTSKRSGVTVRYRAYRIREEREAYSLLAKKPLAEVYVFLSKENHGSCIGMIKGNSIKHYKSKEEAFINISKAIRDEPGQEYK